MKTKRDVWISSQALEAAKLVDASWIAGFGLALSEVEQRLSQPGTIRNVCQAAGVTLEMFVASGLDEYDLKYLRPCLTRTRVKHLRRKHSRDGVLRCDICAPLRCSKAPK